MDNMISILVTGAGAPGIAGIMYSLHNNPDGTKFRVITTDIKSNPVGKFLSDRFYEVPPPEKENYISVIKQILEKENVKVILPHTTKEIIPLSQHKEDFRKMGVAIAASEHDSIKLANDKYMIIKECEKVGVPYPKYFLVNDEKGFLKSLNVLGYPKNKAVVKQRSSNGLRGLRIISEDILSLEKFLNDKPSGLEIDLETILKIFRKERFPEMLVTEYLPGQEYTVDAFRNSNGVVVIPRLRVNVRSGITFDAQIDLREDIIEYSKRLAESLNLKYCFGFQFKLDKNNIPRILESNPRVQGTMVAATFAGFNMIYFSIKEALGNSVPLNDIEIRNGAKFKRYWGGVGIYKDKEIERI